MNIRALYTVLSHLDNTYLVKKSEFIVYKYIHLGKQYISVQAMTLAISLYSS